MPAMRLLAALLAASLCLAADPPPAWVGDAGRQAAFPSDQWLVGWAEEAVADGRDRARCLEIVTAGSQSELARSIRVRVEASTESSTAEITGASGARFSQSFADRSRLSSDITLTDRTFETWFDEGRQRAYAVCAVKRAQFAAGVRAKAEAALTELAGAADTAQAAEAEHPAEAQAGWARVMTGMRDAGDDLGLARTIAPDAGDAALAARLAALHDRAAQAATRLAGRAVASAEDLAFVLAAQLGRAGNGKPLVLVPAFTVRDSRLSSQFGRYIAQELAARLPATAGWRVSKASAAGPTRDAAIAAGAEAVVLGATWDRPEGVRCVVAVHRLADGTMLAAAEATLPKAGVAATGLATAPQNAAQALADQQVFRQDEVTDGQMRLDVWTSKGDDAPVFLKGDAVRIFARVDRPSHLRIIYHMADGRRALLVDDLYIDEAKVNQVYQLPDEFTVDAPFGAETLQANASTVAFPRLATRLEDGYPILTEDLVTANAKTRGLRKSEGPVRMAESRVVVTTVER